MITALRLYITSKAPLILIAVFALGHVSPVNTQEKLFLSETLLQQVEREHGQSSRVRLLKWLHLIDHASVENEKEVLKKVNLFFNQMRFVPDHVQWKQSDYWATPVEFLASGAGDCEDFSIAKYITLKTIGIPEEKLAITYVKAIKLNQAHMVCTYYAYPGAEPLVLDNLTPSILPASKRPDLYPVYTFNGSSLWIAKQRGKGKNIGHSGRLKKWQNVMHRMTQEFN
ncbi:transglutaminase-like cysteine peptidase [Desulfogranum marinum]|uniref:transglutaminase-like cysteine peptidase n=1 Tax=Desulfogranum marinum TaxID=453220 RepID=UPI0029C79CE3|nr:transglutaminase-like cysteine peptidase [Desulfogranum marinum]